MTSWFFWSLDITSFKYTLLFAAQPGGATDEKLGCSAFCHIYTITFHFINKLQEHNVYKSNVVTSGHLPSMVKT